MQAAGEVVLSDVHLYKTVDTDGVVITRFQFKVSAEDHTKFNDDLKYDQDGDIVVSRSDDNRDVITISHEMSTVLESVGLQVWRGALLMCDYVNANTERFAGKEVLELGCGTGLTSIFVAQFAKIVYATDHGEKILALCQENVDRNVSLISAHMHVVDLNWFERLPDDRVNPNILLACDCIYDNDMTDALFRTIHCFIQRAKTQAVSRKASRGHPFLVTYIPLEKRLNFTTEDMDVTCKEYDHFKICLKELIDNTDKHAKCVVKQVFLDEIPLCFDYDRSEQLELWIVESYVL
ncbi:methyltransferase-like protein 22 [Ciona intestinalis]